jgi:regulatory protein
MSGAGAAPRRDAREAAIGALDRRDRTVAELEGWLAERGYEQPEIAAALAELIELGALDDERYARVFAEDKRALAGWGPERIEAELLGRGIPREIAERAGGEDREAQLERARHLLGERGHSAADDRERARALGFLTRRGYEYELAYEAVRSLERAA